MADFEEVTRLLRLEHSASTSWMTGGYGWACSCGRVGRPRIGYPSEAQAQARLDRHLQGARRAIAARLDNPNPS